MDMAYCNDCGEEIGVLGKSPVQDAVTEAYGLIHRLECGPDEMKAMAEADLMAASNMWRYRAIRHQEAEVEEEAPVIPIHRGVYL